MSGDEKGCTLLYSDGEANTLSRGWWWRFTDKPEWYGPFAKESDAAVAVQTGRRVVVPTPDASAEPAGPKMHFFGHPKPTTEIEREFTAGPTRRWEVPDDAAAPDFPPYTYGERRRNPYYQARREVWSMAGRMQCERMIHAKADVTDVIQAFGLGDEIGSPVISYQLGEVVAKILRLGRKDGTNVRQEIIKMHEHLQAAEDAWVAEEKE